MKKKGPKESKIQSDGTSKHDGDEEEKHTTEMEHCQKILISFQVSKIQGKDRTDG